MLRSNNNVSVKRLAIMGGLDMQEDNLRKAIEKAKQTTYTTLDKPISLI